MKIEKALKKALVIFISIFVISLLVEVKLQNDRVDSILADVTITISERGNNE